MTPTLRPAVMADALAMRDIYNHAVLTSTATWALEEETLEERQRWLAQRGDRHPVLVMDAAPPGGPGVIGFASLSEFRPRPGYRHTVENSLYLHPDWQRRGLGRVMLTALIQEARRLGHHTMVAAISADQDVSLALHRSAGFVEAGRLREVGHKFSRWLDVVYLQLML